MTVNTPHENHRAKDSSIVSESLNPINWIVSAIRFVAFFLVFIRVVVWMKSEEPSSVAAATAAPVVLERSLVPRLDKNVPFADSMNYEFSIYIWGDVKITVPTENGDSTFAFKGDSREDFRFPTIRTPGLVRFEAMVPGGSARIKIAEVVLIPKQE